MVGCSPCNSTSWWPVSTIDRHLVIRDYAPGGRKAPSTEDVIASIDALSAAELLDIASLIGPLQPRRARKHRQRRQPARLPTARQGAPTAAAVVERLVEHFGTLQKLLAASIDDLQAVDGVGDTRARSVREGLSRLAESSILERYV